MEINYNNLDSDFRVIKLIGRLDIIGVGEIETKFSGYCSGNNVHALVDISQVEFLASIGIRMLLLTAKSVVKRGGKIAMLNAKPEVKYILEIAGIPTIIPLYSDIETARMELLAS